nr:hypothetical protein [Mesorhizobium sp.]
MNADDINDCVAAADAGRKDQSRAAFDTDRQVARVARKKPTRQDRAVSAKVSEEKRFWRKKFTRHGCHALAALHNCNKSPILSACGGQTRGWNMGFFTEMFARPRPQEQQRYRSALALLNAMSNADRADIGIKPADFPRIAREMSIR